MKRILYCMHVGWNWIKQRPHFIAEELANNNEVIVISDHCYRVKSDNKKNELAPNLSIKEFYKIPLFDHFTLLSKINNFYRKLVYTHYSKQFKPDYMYVMTPKEIHSIPNNFKGKIIYDCMDDMVQFTSDTDKQKAICFDEQRLISRADYVLASSDNLKNVLCSRYGEDIEPKVSVVRNAHVFIDYREIEHTITCNKEIFTLCYFGTIAEWFDFDSIRNLLDEMPNLRLKLIGPYQSGVAVFEHPQVENVGAVKHEELKNYVEEVDSFIMPFRLTELILSVDPVKLYEYIYFGKNIICVRYPEVERFSDYAYLYKDYHELKNIVIDLMKNNDLKYTERDRCSFLDDNTWKKRVEVIEKVVQLQ